MICTTIETVKPRKPRTGRAGLPGRAPATSLTPLRAASKVRAMPTIHWPSERVTVTGGAGFLGGFVVDELRRRGAKEIVVPRSKDYDLVEMDAVKRLYRDARPSVVLHLAARVGGIGANRDNPGKFF